MLIIRHWGLTAYQPLFKKMKAFTDTRTEATIDEFWVVEHPSVFTQGQAGKPEHILHSDLIPVVQTDRGGQVTYHGPGQLVIYLLLDIRRKNMGIRSLVFAMEEAMIDLLADYHLKARRHDNAPGVYIEGAKIGALGLRIRKGCSYHGLSFNRDMDLAPFRQIHPCGYPHLKVVQLRDFITPPDQATLSNHLVQHLRRHLQYTES